MRVILKPAGMITTLSILALLAFLAVSRIQQVRGQRIAEQQKTLQQLLPATQNAAPTPTPTPVGDEPILRNADFEGPKASVAGTPENAVPGFTRTGDIIERWSDNSLWAASTVDYAVDTENPHGGKQCQRATFKARTGEVGQLQLIQVVGLESGTKYRASVWVRAAKPTPVTFGLRGIGEIGFYEEKTVKETVGKKWRRLEVTVTVTNPNRGMNSFFILVVDDPGATIWADDASLKPVGG